MMMMMMMREKQVQMMSTRKCEGMVIHDDASGDDKDGDDSNIVHVGTEASKSDCFPSFRFLL